MAQFLTYSQAREFEIDGKTYDLIDLIEALERTPDGWVSPGSVSELTIGQVVHVWALGDRLRRGVVAKLGRTKATVIFTTQGAVDWAQRHGSLSDASIRVADTAVQLSQIKIPSPTASVEEATVKGVDCDGSCRDDQCPAYVDREPEEDEKPREEIEAEEAHEEAKELDEYSYPANKPEATEKTDAPTVPVEGGTDAPTVPVEGGTDTDCTCVAGSERVHSTACPYSRAEKIDAPAPPVTGDMSGSAVVTLLEEVWDRIRENHPELPAVVMVTGTGMIGPSRWGHFRANGWMARAEGEAAATNLALGEMFMAGETLAKGARQVLGTMLHEAAHVLARVREVKDTSRQGRWHNKLFKALAEELGLEYKRASADIQHGFSLMTMTEATEAKYADLMDELDREIWLVVDLPWFLKGTTKPEGETEGDEPEGGEYIHGGRKHKAAGTTPQSGNLKATCGCPDPNIIRFSRKVLELEVVRCDECEELFTTK